MTALSIFLILLVSFIPDRFAILHISVTYKRSELRAEVLGLVAVFVGDEDYFYSVLVTLMSHYDIIIADPVGA